jgi:Uma2 family endonuclease
MSALPKPDMTTDEFLTWARTQPKEAGRFELVNGHVVTLQSERLVHAEVKLGLALAFRDAIRQAKLPCYALPDSALVRISKTRAFQPDSLVYCGPRLPSESVEVANPVIVSEVLSPDSLERDHGEKLEGYFAVPSIQHYLIVDPDRHVVIHHRRGTGEDIITRIYKAGPMLLDPPGMTIDVSALFEREPDPA